MMTLLIVMITAYVAGALGALLFDRGAVGRGVAALGTAIGSATGLALGLTAILSGEVLTLAPARLLPLTGLMLRLDGLSACFLIIIGLIGLAVGSTASVIRPHTKGDTRSGCSARCSMCSCYR